MKRWLIFLFLLCKLFTVVGTAADTLPHDSVAAQEKGFSFEELHSSWTRVLEANDLREAHGELQHILAGRDELGLHNFESLSHEFVSRGKSALAHGLIDRAAFYFRGARALSPTSPSVLLALIPHARLVGERRTDLVAETFFHSVQSPTIAVRTLNALVYPLLWSLLIATYCAVLLFVLMHFAGVLRFTARWLSPSTRGLGAPMLALVLYGVPLLMGPLWCLFLWSALTLLIFPKSKRLIVFSAFVICLWGVALPVRENIGLWVEDQSVAAALRISTGNYDRGDFHTLQRIDAHGERDPMVLFFAAQLARKQGDFDKARSRLLAADRLYPGASWLIAELAGVDYLEGNFLEAQKRFETANSLASPTAAMLYNQSLLAFAQMEVGQSESLLGQARDRDPRLVNELKHRELTMARANELAIADMTPDFRAFVSAALRSRPGSYAQAREKAGALMPDLSPLSMAFLGALLLISALMRRRSGERGRPSFYLEPVTPKLLACLSKAMPAGPYIVQGKFLGGALLLSLIVFLFLPFLHWPQGIGSVLQPEGEVYWAWLSIACAVVLILWYRALDTEEPTLGGEQCKPE